MHKRKPVSKVVRATHISESIFYANSKARIEFCFLFHNAPSYMYSIENIFLLWMRDVFPRHWTALYHSRICLSDRVLPFRVIEKLDRISRVDSKIGGCPYPMLLLGDHVRTFIGIFRYPCCADFTKKSLRRNWSFIIHDVQFDRMRALTFMPNYKHYDSHFFFRRS